MTDFIHNFDFLTLLGTTRFCLLLNMILATIVIFMEKRNAGSYLGLVVSPLFYSGSRIYFVFSFR